MVFEKIGTGKINLIFLHGWGASKNNFTWINGMLDNCTMHFASLDGFDGTMAPKDPTIIGYARRLDEYIKNNNLDNIVLLGHSFGGRIAIEYASEHHVSGLVLVDSAGIKPKFNLSKCIKVFRYKFVKLLKNMHIIKADLANYGSDDYKNCEKNMKNVLVSAVNYNQKRKLHKISAKTLIIWGKQDCDTPPYMAKMLKRKITNSTLVWLNGGHFAFAEEPLKFVEILRQYTENVL